MSQVARLVAVHCMTIALLLASAGAAETKATKDQVLGVYSGKTHYVRIQQREWALFFRPDGSARGRSWWSGGEEFSNGHWRVADNGSVCIGWENKRWMNGNENCWDVYIVGTDAVNVVHVSGQGGANQTMTVKQGNPYNL